MKRVIIASVFACAAGIAVAAIPLTSDPVQSEQGPPALSLLEVDLSVYELIDQVDGNQDIAEPYCDVHAVLTGKLYYDFYETLGEATELSDGRRIEMWHSDMLGTWTSVYVRADGVACVAGTGTFDGSGGIPMDMIEQQDV